jgi:hypothetical protein
MVHPDSSYDFKPTAVKSYKKYTGPWDRWRATGKGSTVGWGRDDGEREEEPESGEKPFSTIRPTSRGALGSSSAFCFREKTFAAGEAEALSPRRDFLPEAFLASMPLGV